MPIDSYQLNALLEIVQEKTGTDLTGYRKPTLHRRISERLARMGINADEYLAICRSDKHECTELVNTVAINVSEFFRNPEMFEVIARSILPPLAGEKRNLRIWSAGCAAGEEAYSIAILIREELEKTKHTGCKCKPAIFATDIDSSVLKKAKKAFYSRESLKDTKLGIVDAFFSLKKDGFQLCSEVKKMVHFSVNDLLSEKTVSPPESVFASFDIVLCRNVLIYFSERKQVQILEKLYRAMAKGGYLVLGDSETICKDQRSRYKTVDARNKIYQK